MQKWLVVDEKYLDYLRENADSRIPLSDYGADKYKPFFGVLFEQDDLLYVTQISHAQPRHAKLKNSLDFKKIFIPNKDAKKPDRFVAVVNLNYMFPIHKSLVHNLEFKDIEKYRTFSSLDEKSKYIDLLSEELKAINSLGLEKAAQQLYSLKKTIPEHNVAKRCLDFLELEKHAIKYVEEST